MQASLDVEELLPVPGGSMLPGTYDAAVRTRSA